MGLQHGSTGVQRLGQAGPQDSGHGVGGTSGSLRLIPHSLAGFPRDRVSPSPHPGSGLAFVPPCWPAGTPPIAAGPQLPEAPPPRSGAAQKGNMWIPQRTAGEWGGVRQCGGVGHTVTQAWGGTRIGQPGLGQGDEGWEHQGRGEGAE